MSDEKPDPTNLRPRDLEWEKRCDELAEFCAKELGSLCVLVAVQEGGKAGICIGGMETPGPELDAYRKILDAADDPATFLRGVAYVIESAEAAKRGELEMPTDGRALEVQIGPGAFDDFEGTQEELQALIAEARQMFASGEYVKHVHELTADEAAELRERMAQRRKTRQ